MTLSSRLPFQFAISLTLVVLTAATVAAQGQLQLTIRNQSASDGFFFTPVWTGFHDGSFDVFTTGESAANFRGLEEIAEGGDVGELSAGFNETAGRHDQTIISTGGFAGAPVFDPGEIVSTTITVPNSASNRYFSYASMVIPSNDAFFANGNPLAYPVFDTNGDFLGPITINVSGADVYDSGTEVNDQMGAAFSALGGTSSDENGTIALHAGLDGFLGTMTAAGTTLGSGLDANTLLATIEITQVPEPASAGLGLFALGLIAVIARRRQTRSKL